MTTQKKLEKAALAYRTPKLAKYAEAARWSAIHMHGKVSTWRDREALLKLVIAFHICRERHPRIWIGFASTKLENALARAQAELRLR